MRAVDCQANNEKDFPKPSENNIKKTFYSEHTDDFRFDEDRKTFSLSDNRKNLLKNKRHRDPEDLDIAKHSIIRNIKVLVYINFNLRYFQFIENKSFFIEGVIKINFFLRPFSANTLVF